MLCVSGLACHNGVKNLAVDSQLTQIIEILTHMVKLVPTHREQVVVNTSLTSCRTRLSAEPLPTLPS